MNARGIEAEVDAVRNELTTLVAELDRRRHELFDVKLQLRRHVLPVVVTTLVGSAALAAAVALGVRRSRQRRTLPARGRRVSEAVGRLLDHPERVGTEPTIVERIAATAGSTVAVYLVKLALDRALDRR
jgi:hypothetical protein